MSLGVSYSCQIEWELLLEANWKPKIFVAKNIAAIKSVNG